jgi:hypothetical protein
MGILKSKIRSWSLSQLSIALLLTHVIIVSLIHSIIIIFLKKASSRNAVRKKIWK